MTQEGVSVEQYPQTCAVCGRRFSKDAAQGKATWDAAEYKVYSLVKPYTRRLKKQGVKPYKEEAGYCSMECLQKHFTFKKTSEWRFLLFFPYKKHVFKWIPNEPQDKVLLVRHKNKPTEEFVDA